MKLQSQKRDTYIFETIKFITFVILLLLQNNYEVDGNIML